MARNLFRQTAREKAASVDGFSLFFGALLGANLGALDGLSAGQYLFMIVLLAGAVATIQMALRSERRVYALLQLAVYAALVGAVALGFTGEAAAIPEAARHKLGITLACWIGLVAAIEVFPVSDGGPPADTPDQADTAPLTLRADDGNSASL